MLLKFKFAIERSLNSQPWLRHNIRQILPLFPFLLPHNKSFYGFKHLSQKPDGLFLDIGANDGISALGFHRIHPSYKILSIEPNRLHEPSLKRLTKKLKNFSYITVGAGSQRSQLQLITPHFKQYTLHTSASVHPEFIENVLQKDYPPYVREAITFSQESISIIPLDELKLNPDIIKIDAEGSDYDVVVGLKETINRCRPYLLIEHSSQLVGQFAAFCRETAYELYLYDFTTDRFRKFNKEREDPMLRTETQNIFCIPEEKRSRLPVDAPDLQNR